jgi:hypothetical protein
MQREGGRERKTYTQAREAETIEAEEDTGQVAQHEVSTRHVVGKGHEQGSATPEQHGITTRIATPAHQNKSVSPMPVASNQALELQQRARTMSLGKSNEQVSSPKPDTSNAEALELQRQRQLEVEKSQAPTRYTDKHMATRVDTERDAEAMALDLIKQAHHMSLSVGHDFVSQDRDGEGDVQADIETLEGGQGVQVGRIKVSGAEVIGEGERGQDDEEAEKSAIGPRDDVKMDLNALLESALRESMGQGGSEVEGEEARAHKHTRKVGMEEIIAHDKGGIGDRHTYTALVSTTEARYRGSSLSSPQPLSLSPSRTHREHMRSQDLIDSEAHQSRCNGKDAAWVTQSWKGLHFDDPVVVFPPPPQALASDLSFAFCVCVCVRLCLLFCISLCL